jgi:hypothetical protein
MRLTMVRKIEVARRLRVPARDQACCDAFRPQLTCHDHSKGFVYHTYCGFDGGTPQASQGQAALTRILGSRDGK